MGLGIVAPAIAESYLIQRGFFHLSDSHKDTWKEGKKYSVFIGRSTSTDLTILVSQSSHSQILNLMSAPLFICPSITLLYLHSIYPVVWITHCLASRCMPLVCSPFLTGHPCMLHSKSKSCRISHTAVISSKVMWQFSSGVHLWTVLHRIGDMHRHWCQEATLCRGGIRCWTFCCPTTGQQKVGIISNQHLWFHHPWSKPGATLSHCRGCAWQLWAPQWASVCVPSLPWQNTTWATG